jgi:S-DNA-T family DNA segregation ATPase FtsK/SpoIIIE
MDVNKINVTQLILAVLYPAWRADWLAGKNPSPPTPVYHGMSVHGASFHKLADQFIQWLCTPSKNNHPDNLHTGAQLWDAMWHFFAEKKINQLLSDISDLNSILHLKKCLQSFCSQLALLRSGIEQFGNWNDLFLVSEFAITNVPYEIADLNFYISGRIDTLRNDPNGGLTIVDYKLSHGQKFKFDMLQLAIYSELLRINKPGLKFRGIIEYYEPELHESFFHSSELTDLFSEIVRPVLEELAAMSAAPKRKQKSTIEKEDSCHVDYQSHKKVAENITECYKSFNLNITVEAWHAAPQVIRYLIRPFPGVKIASLVNRAEDLQVAIGIDKIPVIGVEKGFVTIDLPKSKADIVYWKEAIDSPEFKSSSQCVIFPIGRNVNNQLIFADLSDPNTCHGLVAGGTGSGKSEFLKSLVASLIQKNHPETLKITLVDPKILTFGQVKDSMYLTDPIITDLDAAITVMEKAVQDMDIRYKQLSTEGYDNLGERFAKGIHDIPYHVLIFDEFADLILTGGSNKKTFESLVARLAAKGRAAGIHLILSTQRPERTVVTGLIKTNLPLKICLRVNSSIDSNIVLGESGGQHLLGHGDLLCDRGLGTERAQGPYITKLEFQELVSPKPHLTLSEMP